MNIVDELRAQANQDTTDLTMFDVAASKIEEQQAYIERLRDKLQSVTAEPVCCNQPDVYEDGQQSCCGNPDLTWPHDVVALLSETPAQSLEAVKREWKESIDSAIEGFAFTTSEGQWVVHRDDVSGLLSK